MRVLTLTQLYIYIILSCMCKITVTISIHVERTIMRFIQVLSCILFTACLNSCAEVPLIVTPPEPAVVTVVVTVAKDEMKNATFTCTTTAVNGTVFPISWIHNGQSLIQSQGRVEVLEERGALSLATSRLILHNLTVKDNSIIQCVADYTDITSTSVTTTLSVLGKSMLTYCTLHYTSHRSGIQRVPSIEANVTHVE